MLQVAVTISLIQLIFCQNASDLCEKHLFAVSGDPQSFYHSTTASPFFKYESTFCKYEIHTEPGHLIRLQIKSTLSGFMERREAQDCTDNYIHVGNDRMRVGVEMLTSYKLCRSTVDEEIVSRGNYLWVIVRSPETAMPSWFYIHYQAKSPTSCDSTMFPCSPVQCVPRTSVCDGHVDCDNARDEYCTSRLGENTGIASAQKQVEPCFLCSDGTCISPALPRYSLDWGKQLWYLCDGYRHCDDGTDERRDVCVGLKGRRAALFHCVSKLVNVTAYLWNSGLCDGTADCAGGEDESHDLCQTEKEKHREIEPISVIIPTAALLMVACGAVICRTVYKSQSRRISVPMTCLDTAYVFTEFSNSPTAFERERSSSRSSRGQCHTEDETDDPDDPGDIADLDLSDFDNDFDVNREDDILSISNQEATVDTSTTVPV